MSASHALIVAFAPGVTVTKWVRIWAERHPEVPLMIHPTAQKEQSSVVLDGTAHLSFVRLPIEQHGLHVIPLYRERAVVVSSKDHLFAAVDEVTLSDLASETMLAGGVTHTDRERFDLAAAGVGILVVPQSIARQQSRKDVVVRPITDGPETQIALVWRADQTDHTLAELIDEFVGIVRGRTARSSRSAAAADDVDTGRAVAAMPPRQTTTPRGPAPSKAPAHARKRKQTAARKKRRGR